MARNSWQVYAQCLQNIGAGFLRCFCKCVDDCLGQRFIGWTPDIVLVQSTQIFLDPAIEAVDGLVYISAGEQKQNVRMGGKSASNPLMEDRVVLYGVACAEVDHTILDLGQVSLDGMNLKGLAVIHGGFD